MDETTVVVCFVAAVVLALAVMAGRKGRPHLTLIVGLFAMPFVVSTVDGDQMGSEMAYAAAVVVTVFWTVFCWIVAGIVSVSRSPATRERQAEARHPAETR